MDVYIAVVSHGHGELINTLKSVELLTKEFNVVIKSNQAGDDFSSLKKSEKFHWIDSEYGLGFGKNNNFVFNYCKKELGIKSDDFFIVLNPDVYIDVDAIKKLASRMNRDNYKLATINLYKDMDYQEFDNSIRSFPKLKDFVTSFLGLGNASIISKDSVREVINVDWAAGSFLVFSADHYQNLRGFDEKYFMYCEDIDICLRSLRSGVKMKYFPDIKAVHLARHENRKLFSIHLIWHVKSVVRYFMCKLGLASLISIVKKD